MNDEELHNGPVNDAKSSFIEAYFADLEEKSRFTLELSENGHRDEALLLCCTYIETLGNFLYWPHQHSRLNFARLLVEHGDVEALALAHPIALVDALRGRAETGKIARKLEAHVPTDPPELLSESALMERASRHLSESELGVLRAHWFLGTLGSIAYKRMRNPVAHHGGAPGGISFENTTFRGNPAPEIRFNLLPLGLKNAIRAVRELSLESNRWFGHDFSSDG